MVIFGLKITKKRLKMTKNAPKTTKNGYFWVKNNPKCENAQERSWAFSHDNAIFNRFFSTILVQKYTPTRGLGLKITKK